MADLDLIKARSAAIREEIREMDLYRSKLSAEMEELVIAERVLSRLTASSTESGTQSPDDSITKPPGIPTVPEMIIESLIDMKRQGFRGLEPKQLRQLIAKKWWPDVPNETVSAIVWRMWKRGQIHKDGSLYMLLPTNEAADTPSESASTASNTDAF